MREFLWITFDWPLWVFVLAVVACLVVLFKVGRGFGVLLLALVIYNGLVWSPWQNWMPDVFVVSVLVAIVGLIWGLASGGGRLLAIWGASVALLMAVLLAGLPQFGEEAPVIKEEVSDKSVSELWADLDDERDKRIQNDNDVREDYDKLVERLDRLEGK